MKKTWLKELQSQLLGNATDASEALDYFSTDLSIFSITPAAVVYPKNTADVRKTVQFASAQAEAGQPLSITPRGKGTDQGGGALGEGIQLVLPASMDKLLRLDRNTVTVQPGMLFHTLQQTLHTHGRFLPPYPANLAYATIGGAVASDTAGERSVKYGSIRQFVKKLKVVLADGSLIETSRLSARELNAKKGLATFEGEIYRQLDSLLLDHAELIASHHPRTSRNTAGYALADIRRNDGSFDLSQVIIGSQGTLGIITEITLATAPYNPRTSLIVGYLPSAEKAAAILPKLRALEPCALEMVDQHLLEFIRAHQPAELEGLVPEKLPRLVFLIEFDDASQIRQKFKLNRAARLLARAGAASRVATDPVEQVALWKIRHATASFNWLSQGAKKALPFIDDGIVPLDQWGHLLEKTTKLLQKYDLQPALWGHAGDGQLRLQPFLDLSKPKEVDKLFALSRDYYQLLASLGGSSSGGHNDGLLRSLYLKDIYGPEMLELLTATKRIFDPHSILNPRQKTGATEEYARAHLRPNYALRHFDQPFYS